jgi:hypothetical protein
LRRIRFYRNEYLSLIGVSLRMKTSLSYVVIALAVAVAAWIVLGSPSPW